YCAGQADGRAAAMANHPGRFSMIKRFAGAAAALVASVLSTAPTMAWDSFGHMEVAAVAWDQMTPKARDRAITLIKLNPNFNEWVVHGVPAETANKFAFMHAATWPDLIKSDPKYHNDGARNGDIPPHTSEASLNKGYEDTARHKYWHFIDTPFTTDGSPRPTRQMRRLKLLHFARCCRPLRLPTRISGHMVWFGSCT